MKTLWRLYYRYILQDEFDSRLARAKFIFLQVEQATKGDYSLFINMDGDKIRGWLEPRQNKHPLIKKYQ